MIKRVISGGQTGADQAGWRAATANKIPTGGAMPAGYQTEKGARPVFKDMYGAHAIKGGYPARTWRNVADSDGTIWFGDISSPGGRLTQSCCEELDKHLLIIGMNDMPWDMLSTQEYVNVIGWFRMREIEVLNVAGHRESKLDGRGSARIEAFLTEVFRMDAYARWDAKNKEVIL